MIVAKAKETVKTEPFDPPNPIKRGEPEHF
jgi:hypothetical protein